MPKRGDYFCMTKAMLMEYLEVRNAIDGLRERITAHGPLSDEVRKKVHYKFRLDWNC